MPTFFIREARHEDYRAVVELGEYYKGCDYIPYFYHQFIDDPAYLCYVGEEQGEIIGFVCGLIHDGGRTLQTRASRIVQGHQGKGYSQALLNRMFTDALKNHVKKLTYSKTKVTWPAVHLEIRRADILKVMYFTIPRPEMGYERPKNLKCLTKENIEAILDCQTACQTLFPRGLMYVHFLALGLDKGNIRHMVNEDTSVFANLSTESNSSDRKFSPENIRSISVGIRYRAPIGELCEINFQGHSVEDLEDHISAQLEKIQECNKITVGLYVPLAFPIKYLEKNMMEIYSRLSKKRGNMFQNNFMFIFQGSMETATHISKY